MAKVKIVLNGAGIRELLKSSEITQVCRERAEIMTQKTGVQYEPKVGYTSQRVKVKGLDEARNISAGKKVR